MRGFIIFVVLWLLSWAMFAQAADGGDVETEAFPNYLTDSPRHVLQCGDIVQKGTTVTIDTLVITCMQTLLLQDNSTLNVGHVEWYKDENATWEEETARFMYGDVGWSQDDLDAIASGVKIDSIERYATFDDFLYYDKRLETDVDPVVNFLECRPTGIIGDPNVVINYSEYCDDITLDDDEVVVDAETELDLDCVIWDMNGRELHRGRFGDIFYGDCGVACLQELFWNKVLLIRFASVTDEGKVLYVNVKRIYVR